MTTSGSNGSSFAGFRDSRSFRFLGIPFAQPPTGDLRFLAAQPYNGSYSNYTATSYGNACIQETSENSTLLVSTSEDCLYLNVYTPILPGTASGNSSSSRLLPVAYWIYGGAFTSGAAVRLANRLNGTVMPSLTLLHYPATRPHNSPFLCKFWLGLGLSVESRSAQRSFSPNQV